MPSTLSLRRLVPPPRPLTRLAAVFLVALSATAVLVFSQSAPADAGRPRVGSSGGKGWAMDVHRVEEVGGKPEPVKTLPARAEGQRAEPRSFRPDVPFDADADVATEAPVGDIQE
jgi:hypothetical protein